MARRRDDDRPIGRRKPSRQPKHRILIVCEGKSTERGYFNAFKHEAHNPRVHVEVAKETGVPLTVVQEAIRLREEAEDLAKKEHDENIRWDEVWGVFDIDEHPNVPQAKALAASHGIDLAVSNPSFELWALLHFQDQTAHIERDKARHALCNYLPGYEKSLDFRKVHPGYADAVRRAGGLDSTATQMNEPGRNPTTGVYRLTAQIVE